MRVLFGAGIVAAVIAVALTIPSAFKDQSLTDGQEFFNGGKIAYAEAERFWEDRIRSEGGTKSYEAFISTTGSLTAAQAHTLAHVFGAALYAVEGAESLTVCDDRFSFGCWHQFVGQALSAQGLNILPRLSQLCEAASAKEAGCKHGIGHGLVGYYGYDIASLRAALTRCDEVEPEHPRNGCTVGAFMEYTQRELADSPESSEPLLLSADSMYAHCLEVPDKYASACGYVLPVWWSSARATELTSDRMFEWMGEACREAPNADMRRGCLQGAGFTMGLALGFEAVAPLCARAAKSEDDRAYCLSGLVSSQPARSRPMVRSLCTGAGLEGPYVDYCVAYTQAFDTKKDAVRLEP